MSATFQIFPSPPSRPPRARPRLRRRPAGLAALLAALFLALPWLAACGGGSDGGLTGPGDYPGVSSVEAASFSLVNQARREDGADEVMLDPALSTLARQYSQRMRDEGFFSHQDPSGAGVDSRVRAAGISFSLVGENLAMTDGTSDPAARAHSALLANTGHRRNMLDDRFREVGVGVARSGSAYWITQVYVRP